MLCALALRTLSASSQMDEPDRRKVTVATTPSWRTCHSPDFWQNAHRRSDLWGRPERKPLNAHVRSGPRNAPAAMQAKRMKLIDVCVSARLFS
jgi:hypothetical protein